MAEWVFSLLTRDSIRRVRASITIILDKFYTSYNHTDFGKKFEKFRQVCGKYSRAVGRDLEVGQPKSILLARCGLEV